MTEVVCVYCGDAVDENLAYELVRGWERKRSAGGANQITLRQPLAKFACDGCIRKMKTGIDPTNQPGLF